MYKIPSSDLQFVHAQEVITPASFGVFEAEREGICFVEDQANVFEVNALPGKRRSHQKIDEAVEHGTRSIIFVSKRPVGTDRVMQSCSRFECETLLCADVNEIRN